MPAGAEGLAALQARWHGKLYAEPGAILNSRRVGTFGWQGITAYNDAKKGGAYTDREPAYTDREPAYIQIGNPYIQIGNPYI